MSAVSTREPQTAQLVALPPKMLVPLDSVAPDLVTTLPSPDCVRCCQAAAAWSRDRRVRRLHQLGTIRLEEIPLGADTMETMDYEWSELTGIL